MNSSPAVIAEMPPAVVTVRSTLPAEVRGDDGEIAVISVEDTTSNEVAAAAPNLTEVASVRLVPVIVTWVPPEIRPLVGEIEVMTGNEM